MVFYYLLVQLSEERKKNLIFFWLKKLNLETPSSSANGFVKNIITGKKYHSINKNIFSAQGKVGNIFSLNDSEILSDNKFSLGGRWLRGFDAYGAGPRNSRNSYVGGKNIIVSKFDLIRPINKNSDNPIDMKIFSDVGKIFGNKTGIFIFSYENILRVNLSFFY